MAVYVPRCATNSRKGESMKYRNKPTTVGDRTFSSKREAARYIDLCLMQKAGEISDLRLQVPFVLLTGAKYRDGSRARPAIRYVADFVYRDRDGKQIIEDVKGLRTDVYKIKRHMMLVLRGLEILET